MISAFGRGISGGDDKRIESSVINKNRADQLGSGTYCAYNLSVLITSWLYVRGPQSIQLVRVGEERVMFINGPGSERGERRFDDEAAFRTFIIDFERQVEQAGYAFLGLNAERRQGDDRRAHPRPGLDRRQPSYPT